ncbi:hypothetical protein HK405_015061, partial [Cladochytrium tenue]
GDGIFISDVPDQEDASSSDGPGASRSPVDVDGAAPGSSPITAAPDHAAFDSSNLAAAEALAQLFPAAAAVVAAAASSQRDLLNEAFRQAAATVASVTPGSKHASRPRSENVSPPASSKPSATAQHNQAALLLQKTFQMAADAAAAAATGAPRDSDEHMAHDGPGATFTPLHGSGDVDETGLDDEMDLGVADDLDDAEARAAAAAAMAAATAAAFDSTISDSLQLQEEAAAAAALFQQHVLMQHQHQEQERRKREERRQQRRQNQMDDAEEVEEEEVDDGEDVNWGSARTSIRGGSSAGRRRGRPARGEKRGAEDEAAGTPRKRYPAGKCPHGKSKGLCVECHDSGSGGSSICHHKKRRSQ